MRFSYPFLQPGEKPITTVDEYLLLRNDYDRLRQRSRELRIKIKAVETTDKEESARLYQELKNLEPSESRLRFEMGRRTPLVLISICPYCGTEIWQKTGIFSLLDQFWYHRSSDGQYVAEGSRCPHLFCIDGALNLCGNQPTEQGQAITTVGETSIPMAAEVPFVKPRVLNLPTMRAVVHSILVAERYLAYPVVYFAEKLPAEHVHFCIPWASSAFSGWHPYANGQKIGFVGKRADRQDYDLDKWIQSEKLLWVDPVTEADLVGGPAGAFPYANVAGRRHPYYIEEGKVYDLPNPAESKPEIILGDLVPPRF
ncbi:MAG TPA: hypothetical protein PKH77_16165 [Anaerolineae bacterium]|nr:hypothetical protein [Anaerolineae bacterium]